MKRKRKGPPANGSADGQKSKAGGAHGADAAPAVKSARGNPSGAGPGGPPGDGRARRLYADVRLLSGDLRKLVETMLVDGATFEDVVETLNEQGRGRITLHAVQNFFRSNLGLQQQRIKRQRETAQALRKALGNPASGQQALADAILMTGLMRVSRRGSEFTAKDAIYEKYERENLRLKQELSKQKEQKLHLDRRIALTRWRSEQTRMELARARLLELQQMLDARKGQHHLGPETLQKIQEIYGLIGEQNQATAGL